VVAVQFQQWQYDYNLTPTLNPNPSIDYNNMGSRDVSRGNSLRDSRVGSIDYTSTRSRGGNRGNTIGNTIDNSIGGSVGASMTIVEYVKALPTVPATAGGDSREHSREQRA
jgi:hypothetical protein